MNNQRVPTKNWVDVKCLNCDLSFKVMPCLIKNGHGKYCTARCRNVVNGRNVSKDIFGEKNPNWKGGISKDRIRYKKIYQKRYPEKAEVHRIVLMAKKSGKLIPKPCEVCGSDKRIHAHHDDYKKPLDVRWLCATHHHELHHS